MKRALALGVSFVVLSGTALAYDEERHDGFQNPTTELGKHYSQQRLIDAIKKRQWYYIKNKVRDNDYKNRINQQERHIESKIQNHVDGQSTKIKRTGELNSVPFYDQIRERSKDTYLRPNYKQVFRARAIDYYIENGNAGVEAMEQGVILGSEHKVPRIPHEQAHPWAKFERARSTKEVREVQRNLGKSEQVPAGHQKTTFRRGDSVRNFVHPFMKLYE